MVNFDFIFQNPDLSLVSSDLVSAAVSCLQAVNPHLRLKHTPNPSSKFTGCQCPTFLMINDEVLKISGQVRM